MFFTLASSTHPAVIISIIVACITFAFIISAKEKKHDPERA